MKKILFLFAIILCILFSINISAATLTGYVWPASDVSMSQGYYPPGNSAGHSTHRGIDITGAYGTPIKAVNSGTVVCASKDSTSANSYCYNCTATGAGYHVLIRHNDGLLSIYSHLSDINVSTGASVTAGQIIGKMGSTGNSTGTHLHFAMYRNSFRNENSVNPLSFISPFSNITATNITNTSATLYAYFGASATNIDSAGFYIGTSTSNMKKYSETINSNGVDSNGNYITHLYYSTSKWHGSLEPATKYYYKFWMKAYDTVYETDIYTFTTAGCQHSWNGAILSNVPNCNLGGSVTLTCEKCGATKTHIFDTIIHEYETKFTIDKKATCTERGIKSQHCRLCDAKTNITSIPATGHSLNTSNAIAHCTNTIIDLIKCNTCNNIVPYTVQPCGHQFQSTYTTDKAATCTTVGTKSRHCTRCDEKTSITTIPASGHTWDSGKTTQTSSCNNSGIKTYTCTTCNITKTEALSSTDHSWGEWNTLTQATCTSTGLSQRKCLKCSATESNIIKQTAHTYNSTPTIDKEANCTNKGISSIHCSTCDNKINITSIEATGHQWSDWLTEKAATNTESGLLQRKCKKCYITEQKTTMPLFDEKHKHTYSEWIIVTDATCTSTGKSERTCTDCGGIETIDISVTAHSLGSWVVVEDATPTQSGFAERKCSVCNYVEQSPFSYGIDLNKQNASISSENNIVTPTPTNKPDNLSQNNKTIFKSILGSPKLIISIGIIIFFVLVCTVYYIVVLSKKKK